MMLRQLVVAGGLVVRAQDALAGGLFVPGSGAISSARAGAAVASTDDGEALSINPARLAETKGFTLTVSASLLRYYMSFTRRGTYDPIAGEDRPYEGAPYERVENDPDPPLGIGGFQPLPVIVAAWDVSASFPNLVVAAGLYTPSGYPFRDMSRGFAFQTDPAADYSIAPPATRYDVMTQRSLAVFPSVGAGYHITPDLDVGVRFTTGVFRNRTQVIVWGAPGNVEEDIKKDALFTADVADNFVPAFGLGASYHLTPAIDLAASYTSPVVIQAHGTATSVRGPSVDQTRTIGAVPDAMARCAPGGTDAEQKACISLELPMTATLGGRYKMLDANGALTADVELDLTWENWGKRCDFDSANILGSICTSPGQFRVQVDSGLYANGNFIQPLATNAVDLGLRDTFGARLGGSYRLALPTSTLVLRGGLAYDTAAAKPGWLRASFDGAARTTAAFGAAYETSAWQINAGLAYIHEGKNTNPGAAADGSDCNPTEEMLVGCGPGGAVQPPKDRQGPDPTNPILEPDVQFENPYNQGSITSRYLMFMLGFSKKF